MVLSSGRINLVLRSHKPYDCPLRIARPASFRLLLEAAVIRRASVFAVCLALVWQELAAAHFHMLFPGWPSTSTEKSVSFRFQWGHPFEHELFDAVMPEKVVMVSPDRQQTVLTSSLTKMTVKGADQKDVSAFGFSFQPEKRGDYTCVALVTGSSGMDGARKPFPVRYREGRPHVQTQELGMQ